MIITRTPYRISFFGGGTDLPEYYCERSGAVLNVTINKYSYLHCRIMPPYFDHNYRIRYFQTERVGRIEDIQHPSARECLRYLNFPHSLEILHSGDIPAMSGIGSSSAFTAGLLLALNGLLGKMLTKRELAEAAIEVEQRWIKENVGSQDQYAAAFGGLNRIDFGPGDRIVLTPLMLSSERLELLQSRLLFCYSGVARFSSEIMADQKSRVPANLARLGEMRTLVDQAQGCLTAADNQGLDDFGRLLDYAWRLKKSLSAQISNGLLNELYDRALSAGALGGKVCGAGGGGFMLFYVPEGRRPAVEAALKKTLLVPLRFEFLGAHVVFFVHDTA